MPPADYSESVRSVSPNSAGFGRDGGRASMKVYVGHSAQYEAIGKILGTVKRGKDGRLVRTGPAAHPVYRWLLANRITDIRGHGKPTLTNSQHAGEGSNLQLQYAAYPTYEYTIEYVQQPWVSLGDLRIDVVATTWHDEGELQLSGLRRATRYATEYKRYTSHDYEPGVELVTATYGSQKFRAVEAGDPPDGFTYPGAPRVYVPKSVLKVTWHYVPMSLVEDDRSPIVTRLGRVNQLEWATPWGKTYAPGSLLYVGVGVKRYMPFIPAARAGLLNEIIIENEYVCDIEFLFDYTRREATRPITPANANWIADGWNSKPWIQDKKFYYVTSADGTAADDQPFKWVPTYLSFPFQWLFTDPVVL